MCYCSCSCLQSLYLFDFTLSGTTTMSRLWRTALIRAATLLVVAISLFIICKHSIDRIGQLRKKSMSNGRVVSKGSLRYTPIDKDIPTDVPLDLNILENISQPYYRTIHDTVFNPRPEYFTLRRAKVSNIPRNFLVLGSSIWRDGCPRVLFVVPSVANFNNAKVRLEIRKSWASDFYGKHWRQDSSKRLAFFFGSSSLNAKKLERLKDESTTYGDIVVGDFNDTYKNLSLKMAVIITWVAQFCPNVEAVVKVDMDTFVNVNLLLSLVRKLPSSTHPKFVFGHHHSLEHPPVLLNGDWGVPEYLYPYYEFPKYIQGHSYVISGPAVRLMAESLPFFPIVPNEDAFMTGILPVVLNITRFYHDSFVSSARDDIRTFCDMVYNFYVSSKVLKRENRAKLSDSLKTGECNDEIV